MTRSVNSFKVTAAEAPLKKRRKKKDCPLPSKLDKGQLSFVRKVLNFLCKCVIPIITHYSPLDDAVCYKSISSKKLLRSP